MHSSLLYQEPICRTLRGWIWKLKAEKTKQVIKDIARLQIIHARLDSPNWIKQIPRETDVQEEDRIIKEMVQNEMIVSMLKTISNQVMTPEQIGQSSPITNILVEMIQESQLKLRNNIQVLATSRRMQLETAQRNRGVRGFLRMLENAMSPGTKTSRRRHRRIPASTGQL